MEMFIGVVVLSMNLFLLSDSLGLSSEVKEGLIEAKDYIGLISLLTIICCVSLIILMFLVFCCCIYCIKNRNRGGPNVMPPRGNPPPVRPVQRVPPCWRPWKLCRKTEDAAGEVDDEREHQAADGN